MEMDLNVIYYSGISFDLSLSHPVITKIFEKWSARDVENLLKLVIK